MSRAVARSKNPGGLVVLGGDNVPPLVEIGLTDLTKTGGAKAPKAPPCTCASVLRKNLNNLSLKLMSTTVDHINTD